MRGALLKENAMNRPTAASVLLLCGLLAGGPAMAQIGTGTGTGAGNAAAPLSETILTLSETAEVSRAPDEVHAALRVEARGSSAAAVQGQVNGQMEKALAEARGAQGINATTGGYWTSRNEENRNWTASQTLNLRATDPAALLDLVGRLQGQGMVMSGLGWQLSRPQETAARQEAGKLAIDALRQRAAAVAAQLGLQLAGIRNLRLDAPEMPAPRPMAMAMARAEKAPAPVSAPEEVIVTSTAAAEFVLRR